MIFHFCLIFDEMVLANRIAPDGTPHFAASHLGLFCLPLPMSYKKDSRVIRVKPHHEKTCLQGFQPFPTQTKLYSHRRWLEA